MTKLSLLDFTAFGAVDIYTPVVLLLCMGNSIVVSFKYMFIRIFAVQHRSKYNHTSFEPALSIITTKRGYRRM